MKACSTREVERYLLTLEGWRGLEDKQTRVSCSCSVRIVRWFTSLATVTDFIDCIQHGLVCQVNMFAERCREATAAATFYEALPSLVFKLGFAASPIFDQSGSPNKVMEQARSTQWRSSTWNRNRHLALLLDYYINKVWKHFYVFSICWAACESLGDFTPRLQSALGPKTVKDVPRWARDFLRLLEYYKGASFVAARLKRVSWNMTTCFSGIGCAEVAGYPVSINPRTM